MTDPLCMAHDVAAECTDPAREALSSLRARLSTGELSDPEFNDLLPGNSRTRASFYWTPLEVAHRAAQVFREHGARRVLDVGAGAGKFCVAAAAAQPDMEFVGVERRAPLVELATRVAAQLALPNASFRHADAFATSWAGFDGIYFFNPFSENLSPDEEKFDLSVELSLSRLLREMSAVSDALARLPQGTVVVSYHGIGAPIPSSYELVCDEEAGTHRVRGWVQRETVEALWFHLETDDGIRRSSREEVDETARRWEEGAQARRSTP